MSGPIRIFAAVTEAMATTATNWRPTNESGDVAANEMRAMVRELSEVLQVMSDSTRTMAEKCQEDVWMDSGAAESLFAMAQKFRDPISGLNDLTQAMDRPHDDDLVRINNNNPAAAAWDWARNQGYDIR